MDKHITLELTEEEAATLGCAIVAQAEATLTEIRQRAGARAVLVRRMEHLEQVYNRLTSTSIDYWGKMAQQIAKGAEEEAAQYTDNTI